MFDMYSTCVQSFKLLLQNRCDSLWKRIFWLQNDKLLACGSQTLGMIEFINSTVPKKSKSKISLTSLTSQWPDHFHTMSKVDHLPRHWKRSKYQSFITKAAHQVLQRSEAKQVAMFAQSCSFLSSTKRYNRGDFLHRHPCHFGCLGMNTKTICHQTSNKSSLKGLC